jgi:hypothetical protein
MKNKLWVFGDSYSDSRGIDRYNEYLKRKQIFWSELLAEKHSLDLVNCAIGGTGNECIESRIVDNYKNFNKGDIVLVGFSSFSRITIPRTDRYDVQHFVLPKIVNEELPGNHLCFGEISKRDYNTYLQMRIEIQETDLYKDIFFKRMGMFHDLLKDKLDKLIYWSWCPDVKFLVKHIPNKHFFNMSGPERLQTINNEIPELNDGHWSENSHKVFFERINKFIENFDNTELIKYI